METVKRRLAGEKEDEGELVWGEEKERERRQDVKKGCISGLKVQLCSGLYRTCASLVVRRLLFQPWGAKKQLPPGGIFHFASRLSSNQFNPHLYQDDMRLVRKWYPSSPCNSLLLRYLSLSLKKISWVLSLLCFAKVILRFSWISFFYIVYEKFWTFPFGNSNTFPFRRGLFNFF